MQTVEDLTGIKRSETHVRKFLKSIGMKCLKVGMIPSGANPEKQAEYKREKLEPRLKEAKENKRKIYFVDASHFVLSAYLGYIWTFVRVFIKAPPGRKRFNVLGALDPITHELITITNETYINAECICELLSKIYSLNIKVPITLVLDNARYQKCEMVKHLAELYNIELLYLPSYSPNLNLIERLWKFVKKKCLYSKYYEDFDAFKESIMNCLNNTNTVHKDELSSLLTLKFQTFEKSQFMTS